MDQAWGYGPAVNCSLDFHTGPLVGDVTVCTSPATVMWHSYIICSRSQASMWRSGMGGRDADPPAVCCLVVTFADPTCPQVLEPSMIYSGSFKSTRALPPKGIYFLILHYIL